jgi:hypothetical protein
MAKVAEKVKPSAATAPTTNKESEVHRIALRFLCSSIASSAAESVTFPLDTLKVSLICMYFRFNVSSDDILIDRWPNRVVTK